MTDYRQLQRLATGLLGGGADRPGEAALVLEQFLPGAGRRLIDAQHAGSPEATLADSVIGDHVSVESMVADGAVRHLVVTGKFVQLTGFREIGDFWPSGLAAGELAAVHDLVERALLALGVRTGLTHTEVKLSPDGPHLIEVNGRLGGDVNALSQAAWGVDLTGVAGRLALGRPVELDLPEQVGVVYNVTSVAPAAAHRLISATGFGGLRRQPGVLGYRRHVAPGQTRPVEAAFGLDLLTGRAPDLAGLAATIKNLVGQLRFEFADAGGNSLRRDGWQLTLGHAERLTVGTVAGAGPA